MRLRYSQWTATSMTDEQRMQALMSMFSYMLIQTSGDVDEALDWLRQLADQYGLLDPPSSMEDLINRLKEEGIIEEAK
jgi:Ca-activated chloride channel family protein